MSTPVVPNKSCYHLLQGNRNEMKNNNEHMLMAGDPNANQITPEVRTSTGERRTNDVSKEPRSFNIGGPENITQLDSERNRLQNTTGLSEFSLPPTTTREPHKDYKSDGLKEISKLVPISRGHSLSNLRISTNDTFSVVLSKSDADLIRHASRDKTPRRIEAEGIKRLSLGRSRKLTAKTEAFGKEFVGRVSGKRLLSASLDSIDTSHHSTGDIDKCREAAADHFLGMVFHPTDSVSEGNIVRYSKLSSTSGNNKANIAATHVGSEGTLNLNKQSTPHPAHMDLHANVKSNEIWRSEAQLDHQDDKRGKMELRSPQSKSTCQQRIDQTVPVEFLRCPREESNGVMQHRKDYGSEVHRVKTLLLQESCSKGDDPRFKEGLDCPSDRLVSGTNCSLGLRRGSSHSDSRTTNQVTDKCAVKKEVDTGLPFADDKHIDNLTHLNNNENKQRPIRGHSETAAEVNVDLEHRKGLGTEDVLRRHFDIQDIELETTAFPVESNKAVMSKKHVPNDTAESYKISGKPETFLCAPTPLRPVVTVSAGSPTAASGSSLKDLCALHVDKLPSSAVLPPPDGTQLLSLSPKVPNKTACNSGIPKPILIHSKGSHSAKEDEESNWAEKPEDRMEAKPDIPKPKHVRPKIITYIRRNPQAINQMDHSFPPPGLPYVAPACAMPTMEQKASNDGDIKSGNGLYDKFKPDLQKSRIYSSGLVVSGIKNFGQMGDKFLQEVRCVCVCVHKPACVAFSELHSLSTLQNNAHF